MWLFLFFDTKYNSSLSSFVLNFRIISQVVAEKSLTEKMSICIMRVIEGKNEKLKKKGKIRIKIFIFIYTIQFAYLKVYTKFETLAPIGAEKSVTEISIGEKENEQIMGLISNMWLIFVTQYNSSLSSFVPNFRALSRVVAEKSLIEKKVYRQTAKQTDKHNYRKGKNYIPPIFFVPGYK